MRIDLNLLKTVMFLCQEREDRCGNNSKVPAATGFLIRVEAEGQTWKYLVTARHNIERAVNPIYVRYNLQSGSFDYLKTLKQDWISSDDSDASCLLFWTPENRRSDIDHASFPLNQLVGEDATYSGPPLTPTSSPIPVGLGDNLAFVGLFSKYSGVSKNVPLVRFGNISAMPGDKIRLTAGGEQNLPSYDVVGYLAECRSWGGASGSPVLWTTTIKARPIEHPGMKQPKQPIPVNGLLGLVSGHFDIEQQANVTGDLPGEIRMGINSGIAVITPASAIKELLTRSDVAEMRRPQT